MRTKKEIDEKFVDVNYKLKDANHEEMFRMSEFGSLKLHTFTILRDSPWTNARVVSILRE